MNALEPIPTAVMWKVTAAATIGTLIEYYDFLVYASIAPILAVQFFPTGNPTTGMLASLATFGAAFAARPLGGLLFGRMGDIHGRKKAFTTGLVMMGVATALMGLLPGYAAIGMIAPILLVLLRLAQGLAVGGEFGGAAVYLSEHSPEGRRGYYTSFLQTVGTLGFLTAMLVVLAGRSLLGQATFEDWGWRCAFLLSVVLVTIGYYIRRRMNKSPLFTRLMAAGQISKAPVAETFASSSSLYSVGIAVFGLAAGTTVSWFTSHIYVLILLQGPLKIAPLAASTCLIMAMIVATPFYIFWGAVSDRIGRMKVMRIGMALAIVSYYPAFRTIEHLARTGALFGVTIVVILLMILTAMMFGPFLAALLDLFPTRVRYTGSATAFAIGNVIFGGFMPFIGASLSAWTGDPLGALIYTIPVLCLSLAVNCLCCSRLDVPLRTSTLDGIA